MSEVANVLRYDDMSDESAGTRWNEVFSRSSLHVELFYIRGTRGRERDCTIPDRIEASLIEHNVPYRRGLTRGAWDAWRHAGFAFLDGGYTSVLEGPGWVYGGAYVIGFAAFRFVCGELLLVPRVGSEASHPQSPTTPRLQGYSRQSSRSKAHNLVFSLWPTPCTASEATTTCAPSLKADSVFTATNRHLET